MGNLSVIQVIPYHTRKTFPQKCLHLSSGKIYLWVSHPLPKTMFMKRNLDLEESNQTEFKEVLPGVILLMVINICAGYLPLLYNGAIVLCLPASYLFVYLISVYIICIKIILDL